MAAANTPVGRQQQAIFEDHLVFGHLYGLVLGFIDILATTLGLFLWHKDAWFSAHSYSYLNSLVVLVAIAILD